MAALATVDHGALAFAVQLANQERGPMGLYLRPTKLADALAALADPKLTRTPDKIDRLTVLAGGTDFFPAQAARTAWLQPGPRNVLDISGIEELRGIRQDEAGITFGALATWTQICDAALPPRLRRAEAGGARGGRRSRCRTAAPSPAISATPPRPPTACRRC